MGDSICDIMMKEHEKFLKTHTVIHACSHKPKTPYQLDLEVKDRKPDIVPKVGDKVKIKSREWYEKWKESTEDVPVLYSFVKEMAKYCGQVLTVKEVCLGSRDYRFRFKEDEKEKSWSLEMFEEVYPQESSKEEKCTKGIYSSSISASALGSQLTDTSAIPAINPVQGIGIATDCSKLVSDTAAVITFPNNLFSRECTQVDIEHLRSKWGLNKEPELQTIKKHRFIKLEKL